MTTPFPFVSGAVLTAQQLNDIQNLEISDKTASYILAVTDTYKRTIMNAAGATTITVNDSIFTAGDVIQVANKGAGTCTITAGVGVTINTSGSLALAQYGGGYLLCLSASTFTFFNLGGVGYGAASGGTSSPITVGGIDYTLLAFTSDGTLTVSRSGLFDVMLIGGGAGGGGHVGGGGGAGGLFITTAYLEAASLSVTVGAGGAGGAFDGNGLAGANGTSSRITVSGQNLLAAPGGGGGGPRAGTPEFSRVVRIGASGGGGGNGIASQVTPAPGQAPFGFSGGTGLDSAGNSAGGGGGGNQAVGGNASSLTGGTGGTGYDISTFISGAAALRAVGGAGNAIAGTVVNGAANTGNGGTGGISSASGGNGGSGIVYVRFKA
jgi:hypothetical protein